MRTFDFEFSAAETTGRVAIDFFASKVDIPLHISLRPQDNRIVFNTLVSGKWGAEKAIKFNFEEGRTYTVSILVQASTARLLINRRQVYACETAGEISATAKAVTRLKPIANTLSLGGERFVFSFADKRDRDYVGEILTPFLLSDVLANPSGVILDFSQTKAVAGVLLQAHFPNSQLVVGSEATTAVEVLRHCQQNDCEKVTLSSPEEISFALEAARSEGGSFASPSAAAHDLALRIRQSGLMAVLGRELYSPANASLRAALAPYFNASSVALCSTETDIAATLADDGLRKHRRQARISFTGSPWTLRRHRFDAVGHRDDRLDIGVAMYNTGKFVLPCLESLLAEHRDDVRVILVNDGSTDNSLALIEKNFGGDPRLQIHTKRNGGCASARNHARIVSDAAYMAFVDADDFVDPTMFSSLLDLARVSGHEIVQGGFRFYDDETGLERPSYEVEEFKHWARTPFKGVGCFPVQAAALIKAQPTIWRRVYRRDFLDANDLWFPEHVRAFDDMVFHMMSVYLAKTVLHLDGLNYHYRQHAKQDIKQADERHFYELETYLMIAKRAVREGWNDMRMFVPCFEHSINYSIGLLRDDLVAPFLDGFAELWVLFERIFGTDVFRDEFVGKVRHESYASRVAEKRGKIGDNALGFAGAYMDAAFMHPNLVKMSRRLQTP